MAQGNESIVVGGQQLPPPAWDIQYGFGTRVGIAWFIQHQDASSGELAQYYPPRTDIASIAPEEESSEDKSPPSLITWHKLLRQEGADPQYVIEELTLTEVLAEVPADLHRDIRADYLHRLERLAIRCTLDNPGIDRAREELDGLVLSYADAFSPEDMAALEIIVKRSQTDWDKELTARWSNVLHPPSPSQE
jgi:hypothetical protein